MKEVEFDKNDEEQINFIDLRGVKCPMNFVKLMVALSKKATGETIYTVIDSTQAIDSVPKSLEDEGHEVWGRQSDDGMILKIKKGK